MWPEHTWAKLKCSEHSVWLEDMLNVKLEKGKLEKGENSPKSWERLLSKISFDKKNFWVLKKNWKETYRILPPVNKFTELNVLVIILVQQLDCLPHLLKSILISESPIHAPLWRRSLKIYFSRQVSPIWYKQVSSRHHHFFCTIKCS